MRRNRGAILTLVIVALTLMGVVMFVLTGGANTMLFQADTAYVQAVERDLIASGLAWARERASSNAGAPSTEPVELNIVSFGLPNAKLVVRILGVQENTAQVHVETSCHKGRRTLHTARDYQCVISQPARRE
jgi:hypothetical protein